jgi:ribosomal protein S18 acetylase RimI-like enzyme
VDIRPARPPDASPIRDLVQAAYGHYVERIGQRPAPMDADYEEQVREGRAFVAEERGELVGAIVLVQYPDHLLVDNVAVDPARQGEGIGRALLAFAEDRARAAGTPTLRLYTHSKMTENRALYARLGYEETERRDEAGFDRVFLVKRLAAAAGRGSAGRDAAPR